MNSGENSSFALSRSRLARGNNNQLYLAARTAIFFRPPICFLVVTFISLFQIAVVSTAGGNTLGELIDIGGGRKMYLECRGTGSHTVVFISGTRGAQDDWTDLIDPKNPTGATKRSESAVFPQVSKFTRVCAYDRPGTIRNDNTVTDSTPVRQPTTAQQGVADLHALLTQLRNPGHMFLSGIPGVV